MNVEKLISKPSKYFESPDEVLKKSGMTKEQKIETLKNWKQTCIQLQESSNEGMIGKEQDDLRSVSIALSELQQK